MSRAVDRNRIRRRIKAVMRPLLGGSAPAAGLDVVVTARPAAAAVPFAVLEASLSRALREAAGSIRAHPA
jgi:ribonuclease P protein component